MAEESSVLAQTSASVARVQTFDPMKLSRKAELGEKFAFDAAIRSAERIITLFKQIPVDLLGVFPDKQLIIIQKQADAFYAQLDRIITFDPGTTHDNPTAIRNQILKELDVSFQSYFENLYLPISYISGRVHDFSSLQTEARAAIQSIRDETAALSAELNEKRKDAEVILEEVRRVAAEQGVSQQAIYFSTESDVHKQAAQKWKSATIWSSITLLSYSIISLFFHKISFFSPTTPYEAAQLAVSKILVFAVIAFFMILCTRNFLSHVHNSIVNKQRQNALMTFKALADAATGEESKDIVLSHAANCIFSPQDTGYSKQQSAGANYPPSMLTLLQGLGKTG